MGTDSFERLGIDRPKDLEDDFNTQPIKDAHSKRKEEQEKYWPTPQPILAVIDDELAMEAMQNNIFVLEDPFRTGFECKACDGTGHKETVCTACGGNKVVAQNADFNVPAATLSESELSTLPPHFAESLRKKRSEQEQQKIVSGGLIPCQKCIATDRRGGFEITGFETCEICKGRGASIVVPEQSMNRPTSGKVVSIGELCKYVKAGDRVLYSNMMGGHMNFKHKGLLRYMREDEVIGRLHGTNPEKFQRKLS